MQSRRTFLYRSLALSVGAATMPRSIWAAPAAANAGVQLYSFRKDMLADAAGTLKKIAALGIKQIESAGSDKGSYYGLAPAEMKKICSDLGMHLRSGHVHIDDKWEQTMQHAVAAGQEYLICSSIDFKGQTIDNYKRVAEVFNKAGAQCNKVGLKFGYHNHDTEFDKDGDTVLYDVLMENTDPKLVHMEMDLGWVVAAGHDPLGYFKRFPGRFPLWHLKDMDLTKKESTEFGKGGLNIKSMLQHAKDSGLKYFFIEQEEYTSNPWDSMKENMAYLAALKV